MTTTSAVPENCWKCGRQLGNARTVNGGRNFHPECDPVFARLRAGAGGAVAWAVYKKGVHELWDLGISVDREYIGNAEFTVIPLAPTPTAADTMDGNRPLPFDRDELGRMVREAWVRWAQTQSAPKPSWLVPYDELAEPDKEADRQIGEAVARWTIIGDAARNSTAADTPYDPTTQPYDEPFRHVAADTGGLVDRLTEVERYWMDAIKIAADLDQQLAAAREQIALSDKHVEKLEALLEPYVSWEGKPSAFDAAREQIAELEREVGRYLAETRKDIELDALSSAHEQIAELERDADDKAVKYLEYVKEFGDKKQAAESALSSAHKTIRAMREALEPFAWLFDAMVENGKSDDKEVWGYNKATLYRRDFHKARAALTLATHEAARAANTPAHADMTTVSPPLLSAQEAEIERLRADRAALLKLCEDNYLSSAARVALTPLPEGGQ